jgi:hypothetical protein
LAIPSYPLEADIVLHQTNANTLEALQIGELNIGWRRLQEEPATGGVSEPYWDSPHIVRLLDGGSAQHRPRHMVQGLAPVKRFLDSLFQHPSRRHRASESRIHDQLQNRRDQERDLETAQS